MISNNITDKPVSESHVPASVSDGARLHCARAVEPWKQSTRRGGVEGPLVIHKPVQTKDQRHRDTTMRVAVVPMCCGVGDARFLRICLRNVSNEHA